MCVVYVCGCVCVGRGEHDGCVTVTNHSDDGATTTTTTMALLCLEAAAKANKEENPNITLARWLDIFAQPATTSTATTTNATNNNDRKNC